MSNVELNDDLHKQLESIVSDSSEFATVAEYVSYILQQVVDKKMKANEASAAQDSTYSKEDEDKIRDRLKNLGYLD